MVGDLTGALGCQGSQLLATGGKGLGLPLKAGCAGTLRPTEQLAGLDVDGHVLMILAGNTTNSGA